MAKVKIRLDHKGMAQMLNSGPVSRATTSLGRSVAAKVRETADGEPVPTITRTRTAGGGGLSSRTAFDVTMAHAAGLRIEAKRGTLARAAAATGLEVKSRRAVK